MKGSSTTVTKSRRWRMAAFIRKIHHCSARHKIGVYSLVIEPRRVYIALDLLCTVLYLSKGTKLSQYVAGLVLA